MFGGFFMEHRRFTVSLHGVSALNNPDQDRDHRQYQQNVNESTQGVRTHHSQQPQDQQDHCDRPKHSPPLSSYQSYFVRLMEIADRAISSEVGN
jgi:hypothetical protein